MQMPPPDAVVGRSAVLVRTVTADDTATAVGSGDVPVLGTPRLLAWCEEATVAALGGVLAADATSVGTSVRLEHRLPSAVATVVTVRAAVVSVAGREVRFEVSAEQDGPAGPVAVGRGEVVRVVVDRERFVAGLA